jgi:hypothetical protein
MNTSAIATRRAILVGSAVALFAASCSRLAVHHSNEIALPKPEADSDFLHLSQTLTGHIGLDPLTAARISAAFAQIAPAHHAHFKPLFELVRPGLAPNNFLAVANGTGLGPTAHAIVAAWYTGTVGSGVEAITVAYRDALMYGPVADGLFPPTYALGGPAWWTSPPPKVGVSRPFKHASATVGTPGARSR